MPRLLLLTDRRQLPAGRSLVETVASCAAAGARAVVLRELDLTEPQRAALAVELGAHLTVVSAHSPLPDVAGVHLAAHQPVAASAGLPHGRSCHDETEVARAAEEGAAYVTLSPVAPSASKPGYGPALGAGGVRRAVEAAHGLPVLALGGVSAEVAARLCAAGAHGVAVMGAVMRADDPATVVSALLAEVGEE